MNGYVPMDDLDPASREEAANEEYRTFGGKDVDFEVKVHGNDGNVSVYNGPGEKFDQVSGTEGIADGTTVHIFQYVQGEDGTNWGKTDTDGVTQGWLNLDRDTDYVNENVSADAPEATGTSGNGSGGCCYTNTGSNSNSESHTNTRGNTYRKSDTDTGGNTNRRSNTDTGGNTYRRSNANTGRNRDACFDRRQGIR